MQRTFVKGLVVPVLMLFVMGIVAFMGIGAAYADDLGGVGNGDSNSLQNYNWDNQNNSDSNSGSDSGSDDLNLNNDNDGGSGLNEMFKNQHPITNDSMRKAQKTVEPIARILMNVTSFLLVLLAGYIFFQTAIDLVYIVIPFSRSFLNKGSSAQEGGMGMGAMGGMGGMAGGSQVSGVSSWKWVSDEAEQAVNEGQASSVGAANSSMGMGGMGMGMGMGQPARGGGMKSTIGVYMKKRIIFYLLFALAMGLLFTNLFTSYGITISNWIVTKGFEFLGQ